MGNEFNPNEPLEVSSDYNGIRRRRIFSWTRRDGRGRYMVDWVFNGNMRNLFRLVAAVGGISFVVAAIAYPQLLDLINTEKADV